MTNQLTVYQQYTFGDLLPEDIKTIHETIAKDCNESQFRLFMSVAKAADANPILQEIHPSVFSGKLTWQFGIDFFVRKAKETDGYLGYDVQLVHEQDTFKMHQERAEDGRYYAVIDEHSWSFPRGKVTGGYAIAYKDGLAPFTVVMDAEEVVHYKNSNIGMQKTMWNNNFNDMFKKHMVKRAMKAAFGLKFEDAGEKDGDTSQPDPYKRKDITEEVDAANKPTEIQEQPNQEQPKTKPQAPTPNEDYWNQIGERLEKLGHKTKTAKTSYINDNFKIQGQSPTDADFKRFIKELDMAIAEQATGDDELE